MAEKEPAARKKGGFFIILGLLFLIAALGFSAYNLYLCYRAEETAAVEAAAVLSVIENNEETAEETGEEDPLNTAEEESADMPFITVDGKDYIGVLYFESLDLTLPVFADWSYEYLRDAPCRYTGTIAAGNLVICGHNYFTQFTKIKTLAEGTEIVFTDVNGVQYIYELISRETVGPYDIDTMVDNSTGWDLTLFTCNDGGQTRCAVRFRLLESRDPENSAVIFAVG